MSRVGLLFWGLFFLFFLFFFFVSCSCSFSVIWVGGLYSFVLTMWLMFDIVLSMMTFRSLLLFWDGDRGIKSILVDDYGV